MLHIIRRTNTTPHLFPEHEGTLSGWLPPTHGHAAQAMRFDGNKGWIKIYDGDGRVEAGPKGVLEGLTPWQGQWKIMKPHIRTFWSASGRGRSLFPVVRAHSVPTTIAHCANLCLRLNRGLRWNPQDERFIGDEGSKSNAGTFHESAMEESDAATSGCSALRDRRDAVELESRVGPMTAGSSASRLDAGCSSAARPNFLFISCG